MRKLFILLSVVLSTGFIAPPSFTPTSISNLVQWTIVRTDKTFTTGVSSCGSTPATADGDTVGCVKPIVGVNLLSAADNGTRPILRLTTNTQNNLPSLQFTIVSSTVLDFQSSSFARNISGASAFIVANELTTTNGTMMEFVNGDTDTVGASRFAFATTSSGATWQGKAWNVDENQTSVMTATTTTVGAWHVASFLVDYINNTGTLAIEGVTKDTTFSSPIASHATPNTASKWTRLGASTSSSFISMKFNEIILYNKLLTTAERKRVETYLCSKYKLTCTI